jgi:hypothetical protein
VAGDGNHVTHCGWDSQFCRNSNCTSVQLRKCFAENKDGFLPRLSAFCCCSMRYQGESARKNEVSETPKEVDRAVSWLLMKQLQ